MMVNMASEKGGGGENDVNDDDKQEGDDMNDDDEETDSDRTESNRIKIPILNQSIDEYYKEEEEEEEKNDDEETMDDEEDDEVTKELYDDVNVNLGNEDTDNDQCGSRVTNLEKDLSEIKQVDQYAQALSSIPAIVDRYIDNKLGEAINKAIQAHNLDCRQEAQDEKNAYIELIGTSMRVVIKEEVNTQLPQILPQAVSDFATPVIEKNVTESLEAAILARSSSQPKSTYKVAASLSEFELTKILLDIIKESKSHLRADYKNKLYDALVESYNTDKDLFKTYGESSDKSAHAEEPIHTVDDSGVQKDQEFDTGNNDEQPDDKKVSKEDWFKKPERPLTPDSYWNKRQHVDSRPHQTWISQVAYAKEPHTSFDELMDTSFDFSVFVLNRLNIKDLTQEILVGPAFELLK
ncbi:hypothetical protein Tco_0886025, partial [Tanacetum coccineum]